MMTGKSAGIVKYTNGIFVEGLDFPNECPRYDTKQSDGETPVTLEIRGMWSIPSLQSFPGPLRPGVILLHRVLSMFK